MTITVPGYTSLTGTPVVLLRLLQEARMFDPEGMTPDEYIASVKESSRKFYGIELNVTGDTVEERAESLLLEMGRNHLIEIQN